MCNSSVMAAPWLLLRGLRLVLPGLLVLGLHAPLTAQQWSPFPPPSTPLSSVSEPAVGPTWEGGALRTLTDSLEWVRARELAEKATGRRLVVSLLDKRLWWIDEADTLRVAPIAIGTGTLLEYEDEVWDFSTPRGRHRVIGKQKDPVWIPPLWRYVEAARDTERELVHLERGTDVMLNDGTRLTIRGDQVGQVLANGAFIPVPPGEQIVFDETVFVPPLDTANRRVTGELGAYKLDLGDGYLLHGTPHKDSIGSAATHGCIRLHDDDLEYLFENVPVGTAVYIY